MAGKYAKLDKQLLSWLRKNRENVTVAMANQALKITKPTVQRYICRRFSLLEDRGILVCTLKGTTRVCSVTVEPPETFDTPKNQRTWRQNVHASMVTDKIKATSSNQPSVPCATSQEWEAAGGTIERLPSHWDKRAPQNALGAITFLDYISELD